MPLDVRMSASSSGRERTCNMTPYYNNKDGIASRNDVLNDVISMPVVHGHGDHHQPPQRKILVLVHRSCCIMYDWLNDNRARYDCRDRRRDFAPGASGRVAGALGGPGRAHAPTAGGLAGCERT